MPMKFLISAAALALLLQAVQAAPQPRNIPTVTRTVQLFSNLENDWLDAVHNHDAAALDKLLSEDFELRSAATPGIPTARAQWQQQAFAAKPMDSSIEQMAVHEFGDLAVVSFLWKIDAPKDSGVARQVFVVDTWRQAGGDWKAIARYASPVDSNAKLLVPGSDAAAPAIQKKY